MWVKTVQDEDFVNYKKPSIFISTTKCSFKCDKECGMKVCQNSELVNFKDVFIEDKKLIERYLSNPITTSIVIGGLEPFDTFEDVFKFISLLRKTYKVDDDIVIYTGYDKKEIETKLFRLTGTFHNIVIKFGRFKPNNEKHYDEVLGVKLISDNQYAERIC